LNLERLTIDRTQFIEELKILNIGSSVHFIPVHLHPYYRDTFGYEPGDCPVAERLYERIVSLPLFPGMNENDVLDVISAVKTVISKHR
jgi:dTDP-4-amino-4,6-dideoxygalactose transaminase